MVLMIRPVLDWSFEHHPLVVAFALPLRLYAVPASRPFLAALDAAFPTREAAGLGTFPDFRARRGSWSICSGGGITSITCWRSRLSVRHASQTSSLLSDAQSGR
jgi:hypothetical protein